MDDHVVNARTAPRTTRIRPGANPTPPAAVPPQVRARPAREPTSFLLGAAGLVFGSYFLQVGLFIFLRPLQRIGVPDAVLEAANKLLLSLFALGTLALTVEVVRINYQRWRDQE